MSHVALIETALCRTICLKLGASHLRGPLILWSLPLSSHFKFEYHFSIQNPFCIESRELVPRP